ncbi:MAG TPA: YciI family protein [Myxococcota bacterium]|nr:YciI family protein [Myxococcota bacterium]
MKYLCLAYEQEQQLDALSRAEWEALRGETLDYVQALQQSGQLILTHALQSVETATTVRVRNGAPSITDGPFAETKETLGGFFLIEAKDLNEAIRVASKWPSARLGSIEVRPIEPALRHDTRYGSRAQPRAAIEERRACDS